MPHLNDTVEQLKADYEVSHPGLLDGLKSFYEDACPFVVGQTYIDLLDDERCTDLGMGPKIRVPHLLAIIEVMEGYGLGEREVLQMHLSRQLELAESVDSPYAIAVKRASHIFRTEVLGESPEGLEEHLGVTFSLS